MSTIYLIFSLIFIINTWALVSQSSPVILLLLLSAFQIAVTARNPKLGGCLLFFFIPWIDVLSNTLFRYYVIPAALIPVSGWLAGYYIYLYRNKLRLEMPKESWILISMLLITLLSTLYSFSKYLSYFPEWNSTVATLYLGEQVRLKNAVGWIILGFVQWSMVPVLLIAFYDWLKRFNCLKSSIAFLAAGILISIEFGVYQKFFDVNFAMPPMFATPLERITGASADPNSLCYLFLMSIPLLICLFLGIKNRLRYLLFAGISVMVLIMYYSGSRSAIIGLFAFLVFTVFFLAVTKRIGKFILFSLIGVVVLISSLFMMRSPATMRLYELKGRNISGDGKPFTFLTDIVEPRIPYWELGWMVFKDNIPAGTGAGRYLMAAPVYQKTIPAHVNNNENTANYFLQAAAEMGIIGFILFAVFFARLAASAVNLLMKPKAASTNSVILSLSVLIMIILLNIGPHLLMTEVATVFCLTVAALWADTGGLSGREQ
ncbi:MAG: O-antigen ligase family protein [Elusimicrobiota bacterium]